MRGSLTRRRRAIAAPLVAAAATAAMVLGAGPAEAASSTIVNGPASAWCVGGTGCAQGTRVSFNNGQQVSMYCYFDDYSRFFQVYAVPYAGRWVVDSRYVANQTRVGHC